MVGNVDYGHYALLFQIEQSLSQQWEMVSGMDIKPAANSQVGTIRFTFGPIDRPWSTLGRAYYPPNGLIVLDTMENWDFLSPRSNGE